VVLDGELLMGGRESLCDCITVGSGKGKARGVWSVAGRGGIIGGCSLANWRCEYKLVVF